LEKRYAKYVEEWGNNVFHWYMPNARFGEVVKVEWWNKVLEKIISWLKDKWYNLKSETTKKQVEDLIKKLVDKKFKEAEEQGKKVFENDKQILIEKLMWKYSKLVEEIEKTSIKNKNIERKIDELASKLEKLDKVEYKEIIEWLKGKIKDKIKENEKAPKK